MPAKAVKKTTPVKKAAVKSAAKPAVKKTEKVEAGLKVSVLDTAGKSAGTIELPEVIFGQKINKALIAQAVRVFLANQRRGTVHTKTRGEVTGSTRKIYRQKGTGRARHGGIRAPIFVKGGVAHGPKQRDYTLDMPVQMKRKALFSALSAKATSGEITVVAGFEKLGGKTKAAASAIVALGKGKKDSVLFVMPEHDEKVYRSARNIAGVSVLPANQLNTYEVLVAKKLILMKEAIASLEKTFIKEK